MAADGEPTSLPLVSGVQTGLALHDHMVVCMQCVCVHTSKGHKRLVTIHGWVLC